MKYLALVLILGTAVAAPLLAQQAKPWEAWQPPVVALPQPNGFDTYLQAFDRKKQIDRQFPATPPAEGQPPDQWGEGPADLALPHRVQLYADVLKLVRVALAQDCRIPAPTSSSELMPYLASFRSVVRLLAMEAEVYRLDGDYLAAANSALDGLGVAQDASTQGTLISYLVEAACEAISLKSLDQSTVNLTGSECRQVLARLLQIDAARPSVATTFVGEENLARLFFKDMVAAQRPQEKLPDGVQPPLSVQLDLNAEQSKQLIQSLNTKGWEAIGQFYNALRPVAALPYPRQAAAMPRTTDIMMQILVPVWDRIFFKNAQSLTALHLREAELAARAYLLEKKQLPPDLKVLVPDYLPQLPADPFGEGPLRSTLTGGKLIIYSIGPDLRDDCGKPLDTKFPEQKSLGDIVLVISMKP